MDTSKFSKFQMKLLQFILRRAIKMRERSVLVANLIVPIMGRDRKHYFVDYDAAFDAFVLESYSLSSAKRGKSHRIYTREAVEYIATKNYNPFDIYEPRCRRRNRMRFLRIYPTIQNDETQ